MSRIHFGWWIAAEVGISYLFFNFFLLLFFSLQFFSIVFWIYCTRDMREQHGTENQSVKWYEPGLGYLLNELVWFGATFFSWDHGKSEQTTRGNYVCNPNTVFLSLGLPQLFHSDLKNTFGQLEEHSNFFVWNIARPKKKRITEVSALLTERFCWIVKIRIRVCSPGYF